MPSLNPDGIASNRAITPTAWTSIATGIRRTGAPTPPLPESPKGKPARRSASAFRAETQALRDFLLQLQPRVSSLRVVIVHSSTRRSQGEVVSGRRRLDGADARVCFGRRL